MELALSLGDTPKLKPFSFLDQNNGRNEKKTGLSGDERRTTSLDRPVQALDLLPFSPVHRITRPSSNNKFPFPWLSENLVSESGRGLEEVNQRMNIESEEGTTISSQNNTVSSFQMDFSIFGNGRGKRDFEGLINNENEADRGTSYSRGSDEDEHGISRKKLRLTKEQSAFLEESFKEHNTLNPKQKQALAKQLNLRPRQVEVWFQNRRARTKLKQTEVDCEYLKRWCESLTQENTKLQKEVQELRALKASKPFYMQLPATTLTMCPSCERVVTTTVATAAVAPPAAATAAAAANNSTKLLSLSTTNACAQH